MSQNNKKIALLEAYHEKKKLLDSKQISFSLPTVKSLSSMRPSHSYEFCGTEHRVRVKALNSSASEKNLISPEDKWWTKKPTIAGEGSNARQERLSDVNLFTGIYKQRFQENNFFMFKEFDYVSDPIAARKILLNTSYATLNSLGRAGDFKNEVEWRLSLRPN